MCVAQDICGRAAAGTIELVGDHERQWRLLAAIYLPAVIEHVHARIRRRCEDETRCSHLFQSLVASKTGSAPVQDCNRVTTILSHGFAQLARALDHLCCDLTERRAEFID